MRPFYLAVAALLLPLTLSAQTLWLEHLKSDQGFETVRTLAGWESMGESFALGYDLGGHWFRFRIENPQPEALVYYLASSGYSTQRCDFYLIRQTGVEFHPNGLHVPLRERSLQAVLPTVAARMAPGESIEVYVHYESRLPPFGAFKLLDEAAYRDKTAFYTAFFLLYFGAVGIMVIYNLFLFFSLRDAAYGHYVGHTFFFGLWTLLYSDFWVYIFSADWYYWLQASFPLGYAFFSLYSIAVLETRTHFPVLARIAQALAVVLVVAAVWIVFDLKGGYQIGNAVGMFFSPFFVVLAILSWRKGVKAAKYYLLALLIYLIVLSLMSMMAMGLMDYMSFAKFALIGGSLVELTLFSLLLAYRFHLVQTSQIATQQQLAQFEASRAEELSLKVEARTRDLASANRQLTQALEERNLLFGEVHHRVRNNLQSIMGLLYAESRRATHPDAKKALQESSAKVRSIAAVHELLYASEHLGQVEMDRYLARLAQEIVATMEGAKATIQTRIEPFTLKMDHASAVGMIGVEVLINALKHARPAGAEGLLLTLVSQQTGGRVRLLVRDNGADSPQKELAASKGMGMTIIDQTARRLPNARLRFWRDRGVCFELEFDVK
ncbi:MAG: 7TM diverse intracellular signaling domain-containing protein [Campylobacterales bacterium]